MPDRTPIQTLTRRELNRTFLHRQLLLERADFTPVQAVERLIGMQAQLPNPPYIGLWTRLKQFERADLTSAMEKRQIVRAAGLRSTLHLFTRDDHQQFRTAMLPALEKGLRSFFGDRAKGVDTERLVQAADAALHNGSLSMGGLKAKLLEVAPDRDGDALTYIVRTYLPLVQVPPGGTWGAGSMASYALAETWFGTPPDTADNIKPLIKRYLAAFAPASVQDAQFWLGRTKLKEAFDALRPELVTYRDEKGRELFDLPDMPIINGDTPAPVRLIPEYDNLVMGHDDRTRILPDEHYRKVFLTAGRILNSFLVDGFVAGTWKLEKAKTSSVLTLNPFVPLTSEEQETLAIEGGRLTGFIDPIISRLDVKFSNE